MGLFKPAWQSKNQLKCQRAIVSLEDPAILCKLAINDPSTPVRAAAIKKLEVLECGDTVFMEIVSASPYLDTRQDALARFSDRLNYIKLLETIRPEQIPGTLGYISFDVLNNVRLKI